MERMENLPSSLSQAPERKCRACVCESGNVAGFFLVDKSKRIEAETIGVVGLIPHDGVVG